MFLVRRLAEADVVFWLVMLLCLTPRPPLGRKGRAGG